MSPPLMSWWHFFFFLRAFGVTGKQQYFMSFCLCFSGYHCHIFPTFHSIQQAISVIFYIFFRLPVSLWVQQSQSPVNQEPIIMTPASPPVNCALYLNSNLFIIYILNPFLLYPNTFYTCYIFWTLFFMLSLSPGFSRPSPVRARNI